MIAIAVSPTYWAGTAGRAVLTENVTESWTSPTDYPGSNVHEIAYIYSDAPDDAQLVDMPRKQTFPARRHAHKQRPPATYRPQARKFALRGAATLRGQRA